MKRATYYVFCLVFLVGCLIPSSSAEDNLEGWKYVSNDAKGFRLYIPPGWEPLTTDPEKFRRAVEEARQSEKAAASVAGKKAESENQDASALRYSFAAADTSEASGRDGFLENVTVITIPEYHSMDSLNDDILEFHAEEGFPWEGEPHMGPYFVGRDRLFEYGGKVRGKTAGGAPIVFHIQAYIISHGPLTHILTVSAGPDRAEEMKEIAPRILRNMELMSFAQGSSSIMYHDQGNAWEIKPTEINTNYNSNVYGGSTGPNIEPLQYSSPSASRDSWKYGAAQTAWDRRNPSALQTPFSQPPANPNNPWR